MGCQLTALRSGAGPLLSPLFLHGCGIWAWLQRDRRRELAICGTVGMAEAWAAYGGSDATPLDLIVASSGAGPGQLPPRGRTRPGSWASYAVPCDHGRRGASRPVAFRVPVAGRVCLASARPQARDEGASGPAAATAARGAEVLPGQGGRPVWLRHP